ncbi:hypothetical protein B566_EDAN011921, partial [Ephemera danica]
CYRVPRAKHGALPQPAPLHAPLLREKLRAPQRQNLRANVPGMLSLNPQRPPLRRQRPGGAALLPQHSSQRRSLPPRPQRHALPRMQRRQHRPLLRLARPHRSRQRRPPQRVQHSQGVRPDHKPPQRRAAAAGGRSPSRAAVGLARDLLPASAPKDPSECFLLTVLYSVLSSPYKQQHFLICLVWPHLFVFYFSSTRILQRVFLFYILLLKNYIYT